MKLLKGLLVGAALASAVVIARRVAMRMKENSQTADRNSRQVTKEPSQYTGIVEDVLKLIEDKELPMRQAFEEALEEEHRHEKALARETGLRI